MTESVTPRPHCLFTAACRAKTPGKHCVKCTTNIPAVRANFSAAAKAAAAKDGAKERRSEATKRRHTDPEFKARHRDGIKRAIAKNAEADPNWAERKRAQGKNVQRVLREDPVIREKIYGEEALRRKGKMTTARALAWCPIEYRSLYLRISNKAGITAAEARKMVEEQIAKDLKAYHSTGQLQATPRYGGNNG